MPVYPSSDDEFPSHLDENKTVIVKFYSDWSGTCKLLLPKYIELSEEEKYDHITFFDMNIDENPITKRKLDITSLPAVGLFKKGQTVKLETLVTDEELMFLVEAFYKEYN